MKWFSLPLQTCFWESYHDIQAQEFHKYFTFNSLVSVDSLTIGADSLLPPSAHPLWSSAKTLLLGQLVSGNILYFLLPTLPTTRDIHPHIFKTVFSHY